MSRIIVKNLPKNVTEGKLRNIFQSYGPLTEVKLKFTHDGKFRQFAFVGFMSENDAGLAVKNLDNTFINTNKIKIETCSFLGDFNKPKAWSKHASHEVSEQHDVIKKLVFTSDKKKKQNAASEELLAKFEEDPLFKEFLEVHAVNDSCNFDQIAEKSVVENQVSIDSEVDDEITSENEDSIQVAHKVADEKITDLQYMKKLAKKNVTKMEPKSIILFTLKLKGLPYTCKKKDIKQFFKPLIPFTIRIPPKIHGIAYVGFKKEKDLNKALSKDRSFISGKRISVAKYVKPNKITGPDAIGRRKNVKWISQEEALQNEENIAESGRIFVRNLSYTTSEDDIEKLFVKYGPITEMNFSVDSVSRKIKGFGTITFLMPEHAVKAYSELDGTILHGRMLHLLPGKSKDSDPGDLNDGGTNYKKKKEAKQKSQAGSSHNWNSLFLGHNAVAEVIADSYSTSKEKVLEPHGDGNAAVRIALGETQIVAQTRKYLEQHGVILDAFSNVNSTKSKSIILVKNLPFKTEEKVLRNIFEKHGTIRKIILPPSGITALVEFLEPSEARKAFTCLAYTKFGNVPLYLEWAPENSLENKQLVATEQVEKTSIPDECKLKDQNQEAEEEPAPDTTLFVKNLHFKTSDYDLRKHFEGCGGISYASVATKKDKFNLDKCLSMGYGFVRFIKKESADKALKTLQKTVLHGKSLEIKRSERTLNNEVRTSRKVGNLTKQSGTKILVRNVPFQAKINEIHELFSVFGEINALRLPKKMTDSDSHRGFAFVDYTTASSAKEAFEALSQSTHLYGRRLVLEWAATEEGVAEIRKRTASQFKEKEAIKSKKSVLNIN